MRFRRILGMSETISAWSWPESQTLQAVKSTLSDRIQRLQIDISEKATESSAPMLDATGLWGRKRKEEFEWRCNEFRKDMRIEG